MYIGHINAHLTIKENKIKTKIRKKIFHGTVATQLKKKRKCIKRSSQRTLNFFQSAFTICINITPDVDC